MKPMTYFDFSIGIPYIVSNKNNAYFLRFQDAQDCVNKYYHNPEWYIQEKIQKNEDGFFDFNKNLLDIGSCYGVYAITLPFQNAYLFEPNPESVAYIYTNILLHQKINNVRIYQELLSDKSEMIEFDGFTAGELAKQYNEFQECYKHEIQTTTLDDHPEIQNIGLMKVDVEGMEWKVIKGAQKTLENSNWPPILFEDWIYKNSNETKEQCKLRKKELYKILNDFEYQILENWGDWENHLAIHK